MQRKSEKTDGGSAAAAEKEPSVASDGTTVARDEQLRLLTEIMAAQKFSHSVLEQVPAGVIAANEERTFVFGNHRLAKILGYTEGGPEDSENHPAGELRGIDGRSLTADEMPMARALRHGVTIVSEEMHINHPTGEKTVFSINAAPIRGADGKIVAGILAFNDITRRVVAEADLRTSEERYRKLFNSIDEGFCVLEPGFDEEGKPVNYLILDMNPAFEFLTGLGNAKGRKATEVAPGLPLTWLAVLENVVLSGQTARFEHYAEASDRWLDIHVSRLGDGTLGHVAVVVSNITDWKLAGQALRKSEEGMRRMSESFTDYAILMADVEGRVLSWNTGAKKIFGYTEDEIIGTSADKLFTPEDRDNDVPEKEMKTARETGRAADERWHLRKDRSRFYASGVMAPVFDQGVLVGYAKIARDLTEAKKIEEELQRYRNQLETLVEERTAELEESNLSLRQEMSDRQRAEDERVGLLRRIVTTQEEERSRIARDIHDQLGQQITALRLKIATLVDNESIGPRLAQQIQSLQTAAGKLDSEVGFLAWELRPAALDDLGFVAATRVFVAEWSRHYGIAAELHAGNLEEKRLGPEIETNLYRITQEALNNIYKHADAKSVNIVVERRKDEVVLVIEDDGKGFDVADVHPTKEAGGGLGLVGMHERAAIVGGTLEIESSPGKGATIFARVPV